MSKQFKVTRGICQGDPLSCALFNLAIELLACSIRNDHTLKGYQIPGLPEKIIVNLYADDTTLFLSKEDNLDHIYEILETWCKASGAKFNSGKTEILLTGTHAHRTRLCETCKLNPEECNPINEGIRIIRDKETMRVLGTWIGNAMDTTAPWEPILDKIKKALDHYNKGFPTLKEDDYPNNSWGIHTIPNKGPRNAQPNQNCSNETDQELHMGRHPTPVHSPTTPVPKDGRGWPEPPRYHIQE